MADWSATFSSRSADSLRLTVSQGTQNIGNNTTNVNWYLDIIETWGSWSSQSSGAYAVNINGVVYTGAVPAFSAKSTTRIASGTTVVAHNSDGTKTISVIASASSVDVLGNASISAKSFGLTTIPRASTASVSGGWSWTAGSANTIAISRASSSFTHNITYAFGSQSGTIASAAGTSQSWTPPVSLLTQIPNAVTGTGTITVQTKNGSTVIGSNSYSFTLTAGPSAVPSIGTSTLTEANAAVAASTITLYVQGESELKVDISASGYQGSTITSRTFTIDGVTANTGGKIALNTAGTRTIVTTVIDSRGRSASTSQTISVAAYSSPKITNMGVRRANSNGTANDGAQYIALNMTGTAQSLLNGSTQQNTLKIEVFAKLKSSSSWGTAKNTINHTSTTYSRNYSVIGGGATYLTGNSYDVLVRITDKLNTAQIQMSIPTSQIFMHWSKTGVGIGKYHERGTLDVEGDAYVTRDMFVERNLAVDGTMTKGSVPNARLTELSPGLALSSAAAVPSGNNLNNATDSGLYQSTSSTANRPPGNTWHQILVINGGGRSTQYASIMSGAGVLYKRWREPASGTAWTDWKEIGHEEKPRLDVQSKGSMASTGISIFNQWSIGSISGRVGSFGTSNTTQTINVPGVYDIYGSMYYINGSGTAVASLTVWNPGGGTLRHGEEFPIPLLPSHGQAIEKTIKGVYLTAGCLVGWRNTSGSLTIGNANSVSTRLTIDYVREAL